MNGIRRDFPLLGANPQLVYLDSACTSLKPAQVIDAETSYYTQLGACGGRSSHALGRKTTEKTEEARENVARFVGAEASGLVWTRNTTEGLNMVASGLDYSKRRKVVTSVMEHHAVLLPFMKLRDRGQIRLEIVGCESDGTVSAGRWAQAIDRETALVVTNSGTNTTGWKGNAREVAKIAHDSGALICIDGAQGVAHGRTDFRRDDFDFLCFSGHKMLGPTGIGALVSKRQLLDRLEPLMSGGGTVKAVSGGKIDPMNDQTRFEAGVQHYGGILGLAAACDYLKKIGMEKVEAHEKTLGMALRRELEAVDAVIYGPADAAGHSALYSFNLKGKPHDLALMLDRQGIAVRSGFFCAQPALEALGANDGAVRASCYVYNTVDEVNKFGEALRKLRQLY
ncbi:MAG: aminotransferase class V-fold PLP-dependent enzyme [Candidatus ainarchaeum sp.]|nr:aminotransferase class V-fold PLP-dependent enzyme [Candidatus ainarchaeum sp.]